MARRAREVGSRRPIAVVGALSLAYEGLPSDLESRRAAQQQRIVAELADTFPWPVRDVGLVDDLERAASVAARVGELDPVALVVLTLSAVRADLGDALVETTTVPVLVWAVRDHEIYPHDYHAIDAVAGAGPVGAFAIANGMVRTGRACKVEIGASLSSANRAWLVAAAIAADLRGARFGLVGGPWPGMHDVQLDRDRLAHDIGAQWVDVALPGSMSVEPVQAEELVAAGIGSDDSASPTHASGSDAEPAVTNVAEESSRRLAGGIAALAPDYDALAIRCHAPAIADDPGYGVMGCLGASLATTYGTPVTCTGDQVTAVAMFLADRLGGGAFYAEVDGPDESRQALLLSNGGELDLRMALPGTGRLVRQQFFSGHHGRGWALDGRLTSGPATLIAFTELASGWRVISLEGHISPDSLDEFPVPHAFLVTPSSAAVAFCRLGAAGAPHHVAIAPGHHTRTLDLIVEILGIEHVDVGVAADELRSSGEGTPMDYQ